MREIRAAAAAVLNIDTVEKRTGFSDSDAVIILAYKLLTDISVETDYIVTILRYYRTVIQGWGWPRPLLLSINDNRYALLVGPNDIDALDYKAGVSADPIRLPAPLLQASVNLSGLSSLIE